MVFNAPDNRRALVRQPSKKAVGRTALHEAAKKGSASQVSIYIDAHPEWLSTKDDGGNLPIHLAVKYGHAPCVALLIRHSPDAPGVANDGGWTPLHLAATFGHLELVSLLLPLTPGGAQVKSNDGKKPADVAKEYKEGDWLSVVALLKKGTVASSDAPLAGPDGRGRRPSKAKMMAIRSAQLAEKVQQTRAASSKGIAQEDLPAPSSPTSPGRPRRPSDAVTSAMAAVAARRDAEGDDDS